MSKPATLEEEKILKIKLRDLLRAIEAGDYQSVALSLRENPQLREQKINYVKDGVKKSMLPIHFFFEDGKAGLLTLQALVNKDSYALLDSDGNNPLLLAARWNRTDLIPFLLQRTGDVTVANRHGNTALHYACKHGNGELVRDLILRGASLSQKNNYNLSAQEIAQNQEDPFISLIVDLASRVRDKERSAQARQFEEKLYEELGKRELRKINSLLTESDAAVTEKLLNEVINEVIEKAVEIKAAEKARIEQQSKKEADSKRSREEKRLSKENKKREENTIIEEAIRANLAANPNCYPAANKKQLIALANILKMGEISFSKSKDSSNWDAEDANGNTLMHGIVLNWSEGFKVFLEWAIRDKANVNALNIATQSPIFTACYFGHLEAVKMLLKAGAKITFRDYEGDSPLHFACQNNRIETARLLLESADGPNVINLTNDKKNSALHHACSGGHEEMANLLLEKGADHRIRNADEKMAAALIPQEDMKRRIIQKQLRLASQPLQQVSACSAQALAGEKERASKIS